MAISTDDLINKFGDQDVATAAGGTSAVTDGSFSASGDVLSGGWVNDDDSPCGIAILEGAYATAPDANSKVHLFLRPMDTVSTNDGDTPDSNFQHFWVASFQLNDVTTTQYILEEVAFPNYKTSSTYEVYIYNEGGQTLSAGWKIHIMPKTVGPHA